MSFSSLKSINVFSNQFQDESQLFTEPFKAVMFWLPLWSGPCCPLQPHPHSLPQSSLMPALLTHPQLPKYHRWLPASDAEPFPWSPLPLPSVYLCPLILHNTVPASPLPGSLCDPMSKSDTPPISVPGSWGASMVEIITPYCNHFEGRDPAWATPSWHTVGCH